MASAKLSSYRPTDSEVSIRIQKIANGFLAHHSVSGPDVKGGYKTTTVYHRKSPKTHERIMKMMKE
jgi:hypothetical protein